MPIRREQPWAAGIVSAAGDWPWSSYRAHVRQGPTPSWLDSDGLHGYLLSRPLETEAERTRAASLYARMVADADEGQLWQQGLRQQVFLGDESFVRRTLQEAVLPEAQRLREVPRVQRRPPASLQTLLASSSHRAEGLLAACTSRAASRWGRSRPMWAFRRRV